MTPLAELKERLLRARGIDCSDFKKDFLLRRVTVRMHVTRQPTLRAYVRHLDAFPDECARLLDALSINVTQFFRDESTFRLIRERVLPDLLAAKAATRSHTFRVWSAGCASGQETYSLAILVAEAIETRRAGFLARVYGTDVDEGALAEARCALYEQAQMEGVAGAYALRHFVANGHYRVAPAIREMARFQRHDLTRDPPLRHLDLVLCRNVLIYFGKAVRQEIFEKFHAALRPGGYLVLGKTEMIGPEVKRRFLTVDIKERVYRKPAVPGRRA